MIPTSVVISAKFSESIISHALVWSTLTGDSLALKKVQLHKGGDRHWQICFVFPLKMVSFCECLGWNELPQHVVSYCSGNGRPQGSEKWPKCPCCCLLRDAQSPLVSPQNSGLDILAEVLRLLQDRWTMFVSIVLVYVCCPLGIFSSEGGIVGPPHSPHGPGLDLILYNQSIPRSLFVIWGPHCVPSVGTQILLREAFLV